MALRLATRSAALQQAIARQAERRTRAVVGVRAGAVLGDVALEPGGYAVARGVPAAAWPATADEARYSRVTNGVPIGAGNFGLVRSDPARGTVAGDLDLDGIPDPLDIDNDGDLVLDNLDRATPVARAAQGPPSNPLELYPHASELALLMHHTVNANAGSAFTDIDRALAVFGKLHIGGVPHDDGTEIEVDCSERGLVYCSRGGPARAFTDNVPSQDWPRFPDCCDADADGFGTLRPWSSAPGSQMILVHGATSGQIRAGDLIVERATLGGVERAYPSNLGLVFATVPAITGYTDTAQPPNSATVTYPVAAPSPECPGQGCVPAGPGTEGNAFIVAPQPDGHIVLTFSFWRPQRLPITEAAPWIDIGGLTYHPRINRLYTDQNTPVNLNCPQDTLSADPNQFETHPLPFGNGGGLKDRATDGTAHPGSVLQFTVDVTQCLASRGVAWEPGQHAQIDLVATTDLDRAEQWIFFKRP